MTGDDLLVELLAIGGIKRGKGMGKGKYSEEYKAYLNSPQWEEKRQQVLARDCHQCRGCGAKTRLQVHHVRYDNLGREPLEDLTTLCITCHKAIHRSIDARRRKPKKNARRRV